MYVVQKVLKTTHRCWIL